MHSPRRRNDVSSTRRVRLEPLIESDYPYVYDLSVQAATLRTSRWSGITPSPQQVIDAMWQGVLAQFVVWGKTTGRRLGIFVLASPDFRNQTAYFSVVASDDLIGSQLAFEGLLLGLEYAFGTWPWRKLYAEVLDENLRHFRSALRRSYIVEEGCLRSHVFSGGRFQDVHILSLDRATWSSTGEPMMERLRRSVSATVE